MIVLGDLKWVDNRWSEKRNGITDAFGVLEENENGRKLTDFCEDRGIYVSNTFFKHFIILKFMIIGVSSDDTERKVWLILW